MDLKDQPWEESKRIVDNYAKCMSTFIKHHEQTKKYPEDLKKILALKGSVFCKNYDDINYYYLTFI